MDLVVLLIAIGASLVTLGFVVRYVRNTLRDPNTYIDKTVTDPILLDGWDPPPQEPRHQQPPDS